jgi:hypothetical protein
MLESAKNALSAGYQIGQAAYKFYQWAAGVPDETQQILNAIKKLDEKLTQIQKSLDVIHDQLTTGLIQLKEAIDETTFNNAVAPLQELAGEVAATQGYFQDLIDNRTSPEFSKELYDVRKADIRENVNDIVKHFQGVGNLFRSAILKDGLANPAYYYAGQNLLSHSQYVMTGSGSQQLDNFAQFVLNYQALAFNLIVQWENSLGAGENPAPSTTLKNAIKQYLGFGTVQEARDWLDTNHLVETPSVPASGDLHDEITYLQTIKQVPKYAVVQADDLGHAQGPMWSAGIGVVELGANIKARPGEPGLATCGAHLDGPLPMMGAEACEYMANGWNNAQDQLNAIRSKLEGAGWDYASADQAQTLFTRLKTVSQADRERVLKLAADYWFPREFTVQKSTYYVNINKGLCDRNGTAQSNGYLACDRLIDWPDQVTVTTFSSDPAKVFKATCHFGVGGHKGGTCPPTGVLFRRDTTGESYWPNY